jgi:hypothetical protein
VCSRHVRIERRHQRVLKDIATILRRSEPVGCLEQSSVVSSPIARQDVFLARASMKPLNSRARARLLQILKFVSGGNYVAT